MKAISGNNVVLSKATIERQHIIDACRLVPSVSEQYFHATVPRPAVTHPSLLDLSCGLDDYQPQLINNPIRHFLNSPPLSATKGGLGHDQDDLSYPDLSKTIMDLPKLEPWFSKAFQSSVTVTGARTTTQGTGRNVIPSHVSCSKHE